MSVDDPARAGTHTRRPLADGAAAARLRVRLHAPHPNSQTVVASVAGPVDQSSVPRFAETIAAPFGAAVHVVVDLSEVTTLTQAGLQALLDLDRAATRRGTQLHVTGTGNPQTSHHIAGHLLRLSTDHLLRLSDPAHRAAQDAPADPGRAPANAEDPR